MTKRNLSCAVIFLLWATAAGTLPAQWVPVGTGMAQPASLPPTVNPLPAPPASTGPTFQTQIAAPPAGVVPAGGPNYANVFGPQYSGAFIPNMPPPPVQAAPSLSYSPIQLAQATSPPVVVGPPVAQGFGTSVAPAIPPPAYAPAPGLLQTPGWGVPTIVPSQYVKFVQNIRLTNTWLAGDDDPNEFGINDTELAGTFAFPNFLYSQQPLLFTPGFILSFWDPPRLGPPPPANPPQLPSRVYSAYLDFYWTPTITDRLSAELDFRIGLYSDFESASSNAIRPQGYGALVYNCVPNGPWAIKGGATYINRADVKILPVFGVIWTPNPYTIFDITFPNPKLSQFAWKWGNTDIWWYLAGEYGGGSWEIDNFGSRRVDINDIRAIAGLEWTGGWIGAKGFMEVGYVFDREVFLEGTGVILKPKDTVMLRAGIAF